MSESTTVSARISVGTIAATTFISTVVALVTTAGFDWAINALSSTKNQAEKARESADLKMLEAQLAARKAERLEAEAAAEKAEKGDGKPAIASV